MFQCQFVQAFLHAGIKRIMAPKWHISDLRAVSSGSLASDRLDTPALLRRMVDTFGEQLDALVRSTRFW